MRMAGLEGRCKKRWRKTTVADPDAEAAQDLIQRHFGPCQEIDRRYVGDITYIATWEGWAYLATVIDLASRRVVGWALADHMRTELVEDALTMAFANRAARGGRHLPLGPRLSIHEQGLRRPRPGQRRRAVGRPEGRVLGQRGGRVVLRHHQARAHRHPGLADESRTATGPSSSTSRAGTTPAGCTRSLGYLSPVQYEAHPPQRRPSGGIIN